MKLGRSRRPRHRGLDDALLPLVNVVFLLMVFFLAAGRFSQRPAADAPQSASTEARTSSARVLELRGSAQLAFEGLLFADAELPGRALSWQGLAVDVRAGGEVPAERVLRVLAVLRAAGVQDVRLLTLRGG